MLPNPGLSMVTRGQGGSLTPHPACLLSQALPGDWPVSALCPRHVFVPSEPGCRVTPGQPGQLPLPGVTELLSDRAGASGPAQLWGQHSVLLSTTCWYLGHLHLRLLFQGAPLPQQVLILLSSLSIFCYS